MPFSPDLLLPLGGYVCGAVPFGVLVARAKGVDPFASGSGNIGATNVGRLVGKPFGFAVFVFDFLKGFIPAALAVWLRGDVGWIAVMTGLATILGHMFSPFLRFRGGKGVATGAGTVAILLPVPTGLALLAFISTILAGCTMSLASIVAVITLAGAQLSLAPELTNPASLFSLAVMILVIVRHRANLARLRAGIESRLSSLARWSCMAPGLHALAVGLWCGAGWFFSLGVAPNVFASFADLVAHPPNWLENTVSSPELGSRLAGIAVGSIFPPYFLVQAICGIVATGTAIGFLVTQPGRTAKWRATLLVIALGLVAIGWPISQYVSELREQRWHDHAAKELFGKWHGISLLLNLAVLALLLPAMALAAYPWRQKLPTASDGL